MKLPQLFAQALSQAAKALIHLDDDSHDSLNKLAGKVVCIQLKGVDLCLYLFIHADEIEVLSDFDGDVDTTISGTPTDLFGMRSNNSALFRGEVSITGDVETGKAFSRFLNKIDIDWEEHLSHFVGDMAAYQVGRVFRELRAGFSSMLKSAEQNAGEYISEESGLGTSKSEVSGFVDNIDRFREDVDRLSARVALLEKSRKDASQ